MVSWCAAWFTRTTQLAEMSPWQPHCRLERHLKPGWRRSQRDTSSLSSWSCRRRKNCYWSQKTRSQERNQFSAGFFLLSDGSWQKPRKVLDCYNCLPALAVRPWSTVIHRSGSFWFLWDHWILKSDTLSSTPSNRSLLDPIIHISQGSSWLTDWMSVLHRNHIAFKQDSFPFRVLVAEPNICDMFESELNSWYLTR